MTTYYVDAAGNYLGGFDGALPPAGAIEVPNPPDHAAQKWNGSGYDPAPEPVPEQVAMWQARDAMIDAGLLDDVEAAMAAIPDATARRKAQQKFEYSNNMRRDDPLLNALAPSLGLTSAHIDALFIAAAKKV